jgi:hypothetical protein
MMARILYSVSIVLLGLCFVLQHNYLQGQPLAPADGWSRQGIGVVVGWYHTPTVGLQFRQRLGDAGFARGIELQTVLQAPLSTLRRFSDWQFSLGTVSWWVQREHFGLASRLALKLTRAEDPNARLVGWGTELGLLPAWTGQRHFLGPYIGIDPTWATHFKFKDYIHQAFADRYPDTRGQGPVDPPAHGWRPLSAIYFLAGAGWGQRLGERLGLGAHLLWSMPAQRQGVGMYPDIGLLPFRAQVSVEYGLEPPTRR